MAPKLLILDLDETLFHTADRPLGRPADFWAGPFHVYYRPGVREFLQFCRDHFQVAVWTSSTELYAATMVRQLFGPDYPLAFLWARNRCTRVFDPELQAERRVKDLAKVRRRGFDLTQVLVVDDIPENLARSYGNLVRVRPYQGEEQDQELSLLTVYLRELADVPNVRTIEKRGWRDREPGPP